MPKPLSQKLRDAIPLGVPFSAVCFRNVSQRFANRHEVLSAQGSLLGGGRFNFKGLFEVLYLSCDVHTCLEETTKSLQQAGRDVARALPRTVIGVDVVLSRVLDLTDATTRRRLGLTRASLVEAGWLRIQEIDNHEAFTQSLGRLAREAGFEAILVPSAAVRLGRNLDIFPDRLLPGSHLSLVNPDHFP